eukprot:m.8985 g.8985  ORF g.8985 m.8985 type:complete len:511 (-) comp3987_c0_seq1:239-1771(-)
MPQTTPGRSLGLWKTLRERASEVVELEKKKWETSKFEPEPAPPEDIEDKLPGISPMAKKLSRKKSISTVGNIGIAELASWYQAQPKDTQKKYSPDDWFKCQNYLRELASSRAHQADKARQISTRNRVQGQAHLDIKQTEVHEAFQQRISVLKSYYALLQESLGNVNREINGLASSLADCKAFMNSRFGWPITVNKTCQQWRDERLGIENVRDIVEESLEAEGNMLTSVKGDSFDTLVAEADALLDVMKSKAALLAADIARKDKAINVDVTMNQMKKSQRGMSLHLPEIKQAPEDAIETEEWLEATQNLITDSNDAYKDAADLRAKMKENQTLCNALVKQHEEEVNEALKIHLEELHNARELASSLARENKYNIQETDAEIVKIKEKLDDQQDPLKLGTTRLRGRRQRDEVERTRDEVHAALVQEAAEIHGVSDALTLELETAVANYQHLRKLEGILEEDFALKTKSIKIDEKCLKLRAYLADDADPQRIKMMQRGGSWINWGIRWQEQNQ